MKKVFLTLTVVASLCITSCNKDDDSPSQDAIVGSWELIEFTSTAPNGEEVQETITGCDQKVVTVSFKADGTLDSGKFEGDTPEDCITLSGTWENLGNGNYKLAQDEEVDTFEITFSGDTFTTITEPDENDDTAYKSVYKRVE